MLIKGFGKRLRIGRLAADITQEAVSMVLGCTSATIANYERERSKPDLEDTLKMADLYNISLDWLLRGRPHAAPNPAPVAPAAAVPRCPHMVPVADRCLACEASREEVPA